MQHESKRSYPHYGTGAYYKEDFHLFTCFSTATATWFKRWINVAVAQQYADMDGSANLGGHSTVHRCIHLQVRGWKSLCCHARLAGVAPEVNLRGIHCTQVMKQANKGSTLALKPRADITRSPKQVKRCKTAEASIGSQ